MSDLLVSYICYVVQNFLIYLQFPVCTILHLPGGWGWDAAGTWLVSGLLLVCWWVGCFLPWHAVRLQFSHICPWWVRLVLRLKQPCWHVGQPRNSGAGAYPLVGGAESHSLWLHCHADTGSISFTLICGTGSGALWWTGPCPGTTVGSEVLKTAYLLVSGSASLSS